MSLIVKGIITALGSIGIAVALLWSATTSLSNSVGDTRPPFTMVYEITRVDNQGQLALQTISLDYPSLTHWHSEVLTETAAPRNVGVWVEYTGDDLQTLEPFTGEVTHNRDIAGDGIYVPEQWLIPGYISKLLTRPTTVNTINGTMGTLVFTEVLPCNTPTAAMNAAGIGVCLSERIGTTEITYRTTDFIPLRIVESLDGIELRRITITDLTVNGIPQPVVE